MPCFNSECIGMVRTLLAAQISLSTMGLPNTCFRKSETLGRLLIESLPAMPLSRIKYLRFGG